MNISGKITKTEWLLIAFTLLFLALLFLLYLKADRAADGTDYTITVSRREPSPTTPEPPALVDLNTATAEELETLSGIGPAMAQRIIEYREEYGPFSSVDELLDVSGIGEATLDALRDHVTVTGQPQG